MVEIGVSCFVMESLDIPLNVMRAERNTARYADLAAGMSDIGNDMLL
jgi:hypothetical protein